MKISIYAGKTKNWWTYLAIRSNSALAGLIEECNGNAVFFDELWRLPPGALDEKHFFYIFWDGLTSDSCLREARRFLGEGKKLTALVVGDYSAVAGTEYDVRSLYAEGPLCFSRPRLRFNAKTAKDLLVSKAKAWLMPIKNLAQSRSDLRCGMDLLWGKRRVVFCGSYGTIPVVLKQLCERRGLDPSIFDGYEYFGGDPDQSFANFRRYLDTNGRFLAGLCRAGHIDGAFFLSGLHLLGREYFIERIRVEGIPIYANGYATGLNVNVYTTPFYKQHVFVDFGSVAGAGNYPRLADLLFFQKKTVQIPLGGDLELLMDRAERGLLNEWLDGLWELHGPLLKEAMTTGSVKKLDMKSGAIPTHPINPVTW